MSYISFNCSNAALNCLKCSRLDLIVFIVLVWLLLISPDIGFIQHLMLSIIGTIAKDDICHIIIAFAFIISLPTCNNILVCKVVFENWKQFLFKADTATGFNSLIAFLEKRVSRSGLDFS